MAEIPYVNPTTLIIPLRKGLLEVYLVGNISPEKIKEISDRIGSHSRIDLVFFEWVNRNPHLYAIFGCSIWKELYKNMEKGILVEGFNKLCNQAIREGLDMFNPEKFTLDYSLNMIFGINHSVTLPNDSLVSAQRHLLYRFMRRRLWEIDKGNDVERISTHFPRHYFAKGKEEHVIRAGYQLLEDAVES